MCKNQTRTLKSRLMDIRLPKLSRAAAPGGLRSRAGRPQDQCQPHLCSKTSQGQVQASGGPDAMIVTVAETKDLVTAFAFTPGSPWPPHFFTKETGTQKDLEAPKLRSLHSPDENPRLLLLVHPPPHTDSFQDRRRDPAKAQLSVNGVGTWGLTQGEKHCVWQ